MGPHGRSGEFAIFFSGLTVGKAKWKPGQQEQPVVMKIFFLVCFVFLGIVPLSSALESSSWLSYQVQQDQTVDLYGKKLTAIHVFAYDFDTNDNLRAAQPWVDSELNQQMANKIPGRPVYLTIVNDIETDPPQQHNGDLVLKILSDPTKRAAHIRQIVAISTMADGIDIDYESLLTGTRPYFSQFIKELRAALPAGKL